jgi:protein ImuA
MKLITCHRGQLQTCLPGEVKATRPRSFLTHLDPLDALCPPHGLAYGAIHEVLTTKDAGPGLFFATLLARAAANNQKDVAWCNPRGELYPPALAELGLPLHRLLLLRPLSDVDAIWAVAECLRCTGIAATVAEFDRLTRIQARRLQLAAEAGGGIGIFLRRLDASSADYAAATRWAVKPCRGERSLQKWEIQLIHGHGGRVGLSVILEACRETHLVRASAPVGHRSLETKLALLQGA